MSLEIEGKLIKLLPEVSGEGANGHWVKREFVIETQGQYPKSVCFSTWGDKAQMIAGFQEGDALQVSFDVQSREYNERWYTDLRAWKIAKVGAGQTNVAAPPPEFNQAAPPPPTEEDNLPF